MKKFSFKNALYIKSAIKEKDYPILRNLHGDFLPEIAVAGRSNVGKSTLLNSLFQSKDLVKTSSVPGKTQMLNFFTLDQQLCFVDLPGYGYAKVPEKVRQQWGPMVQTYLNKRETLHIVLCLFDIRRMPNVEDRQLLEWAIQAHKAVILVLTKVDKVTINEKKSQTERILKAFNFGNLHYVHYSSIKRIGYKELVGMLKDALQKEEEEQDLTSEELEEEEIENENANGNS